MTRESLKEYYMQIVPENGEDTLASRWRPDILCEQVDLIFDEFENRTCENCRCWNITSGTYGLCSQLGSDVYIDDISLGEVETYFKFGCNKFIRKDNE